MEAICFLRRFLRQGLFYGSLLYVFTNVSALSPSTEEITESNLNSLMDSVEVLNLMVDQRSRQLCREVYAEAKKISNPKIQTRVLNELSDIFRSFREYDSAEYFIRQAKEIIMNNQLTDDIEYARNLYYTGKLLRSVHAGSINSVRDSIFRCYEQAWKISDKLKNTDYNFKANLLFGIGYLHQTLDDIDEANEYYSQLIHFLGIHFEKRNYRRGMYLYFLALHYTDIGDYERSLILAQTAASILGSNPITDNRRFLQSEWLIGDNFYNMEQYQNAADQYQRVIYLITEKGDYKNPILIDLYSNISQPYIYMNQYDKAIEFANLAVSLADSTSGYAENMYYMFNNLAEAYEKKGEYKIAESYFKKSIGFRRELYGPAHQEVANGYMYFGDYYRRMGNYSEALTYYQKSLGALFQDADSVDIYNNPNFESFPDIEQLLYILFRKAGAFYRLYDESDNMEDLQISYSMYQTIYRLIDKLLSGNYLDKSSMQIFRRFDSELLLSIDCAALLYDNTNDQKYLDQSFQFIEKNKYFLLRKALSDTEQNVYNSESGFQKSKKNFASEIGKLQQAINLTVDAEKRFDLQNELLEIYNERDQLYRKTHSAENLSVSEEENTISVTDAQGLVTSNTDLLVEYHWSADHVYAFVISRKSADLIRINCTDKLSNSIDQYSDALTAGVSHNTSFKNFTSAAYNLYDNLVQPIERLAKEKLEIGRISRLIIVPDGPLATLPFEAFISKQDSISGSYWGLEYLCRKYIMSYAYSLNILKKNLEGTVPTEEHQLLAMSYSEATDTDSGLPELGNELPYSAKEILSISKHLNADEYLGRSATEKTFKEIADKYSVIHLAMHGQADTSDMFNSRLIFRTDTSSSEDGELHVFELYDMDFSNMELAVLSACETGIGKNYKGEGIFSIARGFAFAGCPSIVLSLWKVNDKTTSDLMDYFYADLTLAMPKDEALRNAKLSFINNADDLSAHPANWAAFIALGNNQPLQLSQSVNHLYIYLIGIGIVILLIVFRRSIIRFSHNAKVRWEQD